MRVRNLVELVLINMKKIKRARKNKLNLGLIALIILGLVTILLAFFVNRQVTINTKAAPLRIYGGQDASIKDWPNVVVLFDYREATKRGLSASSISSARICTGSVIADNWIITAAHCVKNPKDPNFGIATGFDDFSSQGIDFSKGRYTFKPKASEIYIHNSYKVYNLGGPNKGKVMAVADLALIKINTSNRAKLIPISLVSKIDYSAKSYVVGWGFAGTDNQGKAIFSDRLKELEVKLVKKGLELSITDAFFGTKFNDKLMTNYFAAGQYLAPGDSGAPLMAFDSKSGKYVQVAVNTSGLPMTDLTKYKAWIKDVTGLVF